MHTIPQSLDSRGKCQKGWDSICPHSLEESGAFGHLGYRISMDVTTNPLSELSCTALPRSVSIWSGISQLDVTPSVSKSTGRKSQMKTGWIQVRIFVYFCCFCIYALDYKIFSYIFGNFTKDKADFFCQEVTSPVKTPLEWRNKTWCWKMSWSRMTAI